MNLIAPNFCGHRHQVITRGVDAVSEVLLRVQHHSCALGGDIVGREERRLHHSLVPPIVDTGALRGVPESITFKHNGMTDSIVGSPALKLNRDRFLWSNKENTRP